MKMEKAKEKGKSKRQGQSKGESENEMGKQPSRGRFAQLRRFLVFVFAFGFVFDHMLIRDDSLQPMVIIESVSRCL